MTAKSDESVLVVAFDGLDYELIQDFELDHILQKEFGTLDNDTDIYKRKTSELFTSLITGTTYKGHGVKSMKRLRNGDKYGSNIPDWLIENVRGFYRLNQLLRSSEEKHRWVRKTDYPQRTLFEQVENSKALNVPGYNPSPVGDYLWDLLKQDRSAEEVIDYYDSREYMARRKEVLSNINRYSDLVFAHFQRVDVHQHIYGNQGSENFERLEDIYRETDDLAREIKQYFSEYYEYVVFLSDHGRPDGDQHNEQAFYSCNRELFGDSTPHITDFYRKIVELEEGQQSINKVGVNA